MWFGASFGFELPSCLHIRVSHAGSQVMKTVVHNQLLAFRVQSLGLSHRENLRVRTVNYNAHSIVTGNVVMQSFRGMWIFKSKRAALKIAYIHWLVVHEDKFDCFLLMCGSYQVGGLKMHRIKLILCSNWVFLKQACICLHNLESS